MTKSELKNFIGSKGGLKSYPTNYRDPDADKVNKAWDEAIAMFNRESGRRLHRGCGSCMRTTWEWLQH